MNRKKLVTLVVAGGLVAASIFMARQASAAEAGGAVTNGAKRKPKGAADVLGRQFLGTLPAQKKAKASVSGVRAPLDRVAGVGGKVAPARLSIAPRRPPLAFEGRGFGNLGAMPTLLAKLQAKQQAKQPARLGVYKAPPRTAKSRRRLSAA